jgi:peptide/nickel transport system permease protein
VRARFRQRLQSSAQVPGAHDPVTEIWVAGAGLLETRPGTAHPVLVFLGRRILVALFTLVVISVLIFVGTQVLPGDAANAILGRNATPAALAAIRHQLHLDAPLYEQYGRWIAGLVRGDLGRSAASQLPISGLIGGPARNSAILAGCAALLLIPLALLLGISAAARAGRSADHVISSGSLALTALPEFVTGTILILIFALGLGALPAVSFLTASQSPLQHPAILVLPVVTLLSASLAQTLRMVRAGMVEALNSEYVQMARLNGYRERDVVLRFALRNALAPTVQVFALNIQWLVGGIVVTEYVFGYPGLGQALVNAVASRDIPLVQTVALLIAAVYLVLNIVADLLVVLLIPKLRTAL